MSGTFIILEGDAREQLQAIAPRSVHCIVTSPPYWGLRDYGEAGQLGLERTPTEYIANLIEVFRELWRVLRNDGVAFLNLGDSYASSTKSAGRNDTATMYGKDSQHLAEHRNIKTDHGVKTKDLIGIPWRTALALQAEGWYLRSDIIWSKPNAMPESARDRCTNAHEYLFQFSKSPRYFFDAVAIEEKASGVKGGASFGKQLHDTTGTGAQSRKYDRPEYHTRLPRSVWTIPTASYSEAHFATFPVALPERCIKAGTSEKGCCSKCGTPWERIVERERSYDHVTSAAGKSKDGPYANQTGEGAGTHDVRHGVYSNSITTGWRATCNHDGEPIPCIVLDPFSGSGATGVAACKLDRNYVGLELNPEYAEMSRNRIGKALSPATHVDESKPVDAPLFNPKEM